MRRLLIVAALALCIPSLLAQSRPADTADSAPTWDASPGTPFNPYEARWHQAAERARIRAEHAAERAREQAQRAAERARRLEERANRFGDRVDRFGDRFDRFGERVDAAADRVGNQVDATAERVADGVGEQAERFGEQAGPFGERLGDQAGRFGERVGERAGQFGERVGETAGRAGERFGERVGEAASRFGERMGRFGERLGRFGERIGERGLHLRVARDYHLAADAAAQEPVVVIGGNATIDGHADDSVIVVGGRLRVGPRAVVRGDLTAIGGTIDIDPAAQVRGAVHDESNIVPDLSAWPGWALGWPSRGSRGWALASLSFTAVRLGLVLLTALFLAVVAPRWIGRIATRVSDRPLGSLVVGVASELLAVPATVIAVLVLIVSLIGIPLLGVVPFATMAFMLLWAAGFAGVAARVGSRLRGRPTIDRVGVVDVFTGFTVLTALTVAGHLAAAWSLGPMARLLSTAGAGVEFIAWTVGLGAAMGAFFGCRRRRVAAPVAAAPAHA